MKIKPSIPKGTRDFSAKEIYKRQYISTLIKQAYELFGFEPIETPTMENMDVLTGKYGEEGEQLLFKIINNGDFLKKVNLEHLTNKNYEIISSQIAEKGLRYDLTVPFARYVSQYRNEITFPFKRYQIQQVWRGDRPQQGRYREFVQCDADVFGTDSLLAESEFLQLFDLVFRRLQMHPYVTIRLNHRKILQGIAELIGAQDDLYPLTTAIDKLDKIGIEGVSKELLDKGFEENQIQQLSELLTQPYRTIDELEQLFAHSAMGRQAVTDVRTIFDNLQGTTVALDSIKIDISLARGLSYYTGTIFEVIVKDTSIGSICGGGRYDNLTDVFGFKNMTGVGISFGLDRIYDVIEEKQLWPAFLQNKTTTTRVLVTNLDDQLRPKLVDFLEKLRFNHVNAELYLAPAKLAKQLKYANDKGIPYVVVIGEEEVNKGEYQLKFMESGKQQYLAPAYIINALKPRL